MKRLMILFAVLTAVALIASPAFAEVQNVKISGDINSAGVYRNQYDLRPSTADGAGSAVSSNINSLVTQARVCVDADLTDNVSATIRLLSEYDWDTENAGNSGVNAANDDVNLDLANITLKEVFYAPLSVTVGRQELRLGNAFILSDPDTNTTSADTSITTGDLSLRKSFDAVSAVLDYDPLVVDVIFAKIDDSNAGIASPTVDTNTDEDEDLYGINASYDVGSYDAEVEGYWLLNRNNDKTATDATGDAIDTIGIRGSLVPIDNLNLSGEIAFQSGDFTSTREQDAMAYQIAADYALADFSIPWTSIEIGSPILKLGYTHYDGEEVVNSGDHSAWIPLYEDQTHGIVANYILGGVNGGQNSNANILNVGASIVPIEDLTVSLDYYNFSLDEKLVAGNNDLASTGSALDWGNIPDESDYFMFADDDLGYEIDLALNYDYSEDVKMGLCAGLFNPGDAFDGSSGDTTNSQSAMEVLATLDVAF